MDWPQIAELCEIEVQRLRSQLPDVCTFFPEPSEVASAFLAYERDTNDAVEAAVRQFAVSRAWPKLSPTERLMLGFRLDFAVGLASLLAQQPAPWTDSEDAAHDENRIGWLLLFAWQQEGFSTLHESLIQLLPPRA